jgi:hypothetical protein
MDLPKIVMRFLGMYAPFQNIRVAMYRKAGVKIGKPLVFGSNIFIDVIFCDVTIGDNVLLAGYDRIISHSNVRYGWKTDEGERSPVVIKNGARISMDVDKQCDSRWGSRKQEHTSKLHGSRRPSKSHKILQRKLARAEKSKHTFHPLFHYVDTSSTTNTTDRSKISANKVCIRS